MIAARKPDQVQFFQLYVNGNRQITADLIKKAERGGCKALFVTVDAPQLGRREKGKEREREREKRTSK